MFLFVSLVNSYSWFVSGLYWAAITSCRGSSQSVVVTVNDAANDVRGDDSGRDDGARVGDKQLRKL